MSSNVKPTLQQTKPISLIDIMKLHSEKKKELQAREAVQKAIEEE